MDYSYDYINGEVRFLNFVVPNAKKEETVYSVNTLKIQEVIEPEYLTPLVSSYLPFIGIYDLRGMPVPVIDVNYKLTGVETTKLPNSPAPRILICDIMGRLVGIQVSKILNIQSFNNGDVLAIPPDLGNIQNAFCTSVIRTQSHKYFSVLDIEKMLEGYVEIKEVGQLKTPKIGQNLKVLIVEDSRVFQKRAENIFQLMGFQTTIAENGLVALDLVHKEKFDLIFCDIEMPQMNGLEFVGKIKLDLQLQNIPVIFNSSISTETMVAEIKNKNLGDYIVKFDPDIIIKQVETIVRSLK